MQFILFNLERLVGSNQHESAFILTFLSKVEVEEKNKSRDKLRSAWLPRIQVMSFLEIKQILVIHIDSHRNAYSLQPMMPFIKSPYDTKKFAMTNTIILLNRRKGLGEEATRQNITLVMYLREDRPPTVLLQRNPQPPRRIV